MLTRRDGSPLTNASLLHVTSGAETLDRLAETYYSPANLGGMGRGEFKQQIIAANPQLTTVGSVLRSNQILRIDLIPRRSKAPMCRAEDLNRDLEHCGEIWRTMSPNVRAAVLEHSESLHLLEEIFKIGAVVFTGAAEAAEAIFHETGHGIKDVAALYKSFKAGAGHSSKAAQYAARSELISKISQRLGEFIRRIISMRPVNSALKITAQEGRQAGVLLASEGHLEGLPLFASLLSKFANLTELAATGAMLGKAIDLGFKLREVEKAREEFKQALAARNLIGFSASALTSVLMIAFLPEAAGGMTFIVMVGLIPAGVDVGAMKVAEQVMTGRGIKWRDEHGLVHEVPETALIGMCHF